MAYGRKYFIAFKNRQLDDFTVDILQKDYTGPAYALEGGANPFILEYRGGDENVIEPIKASGAKISFYNNGGAPVTNFLSENDEEFRVEFYKGTTLKWSGYIVQDDCSEPFVRQKGYEVTIQATDGLGLLKEVEIKKALEDKDLLNRTFFANVSTTGSHTLTILSSGIPTLTAGMKIGIGLTTFNGLYTVSSASQIGATNTITIVETVGTNTLHPAHITIYDKAGFYNKYPLLTFIRACLLSTGLELPINIYCNVFEQFMIWKFALTTAEPFIQAKINAKTFLKDQNTSEDCYSVLQKILAAWKCTLIQAEGEWHIVRWLELKDNPALQGVRYTSDLSGVSLVNFASAITVGGNLPVLPLNASHVRSIKRPDKYMKLQFDYEQPFKLLLNDDLMATGALLSTYTQLNTTTNTLDTINEYEMLYWSLVVGANNPSYFIRVVIDDLGIEKDRYAVVKGGAAGNQRAVASTPIEVNAVDRIKWSFQFRTSDSQAGNVNTVFVVMITNGLLTYYLHEDRTWKTTTGAVYNVPSGDNTNQWHSVSFESNGIPIDGKMTIYLNQADLSGAVNETHFKDLNLDYTFFINDSTQIIGHVHKSEQKKTIKNKYEETIYVDDAPKTPMKGVMFLADGLTKTRSWLRWSSIGAVTTTFRAIVTKLFNVVQFNGFSFTDMSLVHRFSVGSTFTVAGSTSNNGTFTVKGVAIAADNKSFLITVKEPVVNEIITNKSLTFNGEKKQFGYIQKVDEMMFHQQSRVRIEGDFFGLKDTSEITPLSVLKWDGVPEISDVFFIMGQVSFNYSKATWTGVIEELYRNRIYNENMFENTFYYIYKDK